MNFDILQLNDMIVPELLDIAKKLKVIDPKSNDKQNLIYQILDAQALNPISHAKAPAKTTTKEVKEIKPKKSPAKKEKIEASKVEADKVDSAKAETVKTETKKVAVTEKVKKEPEIASNEDIDQTSKVSKAKKIKS